MALAVTSPNYELDNHHDWLLGLRAESTIMFMTIKSAWKTHLEELGRGANFPGCEYLLSKFVPHVIFVLSAAGCRVPIGETRSGSGIEPLGYRAHGAGRRYSAAWLSCCPTG